MQQLRLQLNQVVHNLLLSLLLLLEQLLVCWQDLLHWCLQLLWWWLQLGLLLDV